MRTATRWGVGVIIATALLSLPAEGLAVFPGNNGDILFVSGRPNDDVQAEIFAIDGPADLTPTGPLTLLAGQHRHPNWSPDARSMVFALHNGANAHDIWVHDVDSVGSSVNLTTSPLVTEDHPTFSPDGTKVAYESEVTDGSNQRDILIENVDGSGSPINLTSSGTFVEQTPVWSPNGRLIYYARKLSMAATDLDIVRERADNSSAFPTLVTDAQTAAPEWQPEISPDGKRVCFTFGDFGAAAADIFVANVDGSGDPFELNLNDSATPIADYNCGWAPDGETIAFTRGAFGTGELQFADASGAGDPVPYGSNDNNNFDGNVDWARIPGVCKGKPATIAGDDGPDDIEGTAGRDVIVTFKGADTVNGRGDRDVVCGGGGPDELAGGGNDDRLFGAVGDDELRGGSGDDDLEGGPGDDDCVGGPGDDRGKCERESGF